MRKWTSDEDNKLLEAVKMHVRNDWAAIATLVPGRTKTRYSSRWRIHMDPNRRTVRDAYGKALILGQDHSLS
jgi:hypothetical protein